jgi:hypothetical protein
MPIDSRPGRTILGGDPLPSLKTMARKGAAFLPFFGFLLRASADAEMLIWLGAVLQTNLSLLESVGDAPFSLVESVLSQCGAVQLATIELASPVSASSFFLREEYDLS